MEKEKLEEDVFKFLQENSTAVIATSYKDHPRASTVYYVADRDFNFYFVTRRNTSKYINAEMNPRASVVVGTGPEHITVQAHGRVELIVNDEERDKILKLMSDKEALRNIQSKPVDELKDFKRGYSVIFKIVPSQLFYMNIDSTTHPDTKSDDYIKII